MYLDGQIGYLEVVGVFPLRCVFTRARVLIAAATAAGVVLLPGAANAGTGVTGTSAGPATDPGSLLTLYGVAEPGVSPGCTVLTTDEGRQYDLNLPLQLRRDQRDLAFGIPLGVPLEVQAEPTDQASYCMQGLTVIVEHLTVLDE